MVSWVEASGKESAKSLHCHWHAADRIDQASGDRARVVPGRPGEDATWQTWQQHKEPTVERDTVCRDAFERTMLGFWANAASAKAKFTRRAGDAQRR